MLSTIVVPNRNSWRHCRAKAALEGKHGVKLLTIDQLAARLAGGFLQPIDSDHVATAVGESISLPLGELDAIKTLPGFQRAAVNSLSKAWSAGLSLDHEAKAAMDQAARIRLEALALLEREVLARLPKNEMRPNDLVARALKRMGYARVLFGSIEIHGRTEMSPVWRPLLAALVTETEVTWVAEARRVPPWLALLGVTTEERAPEQPVRRSISCASPRHEILEAVRWARSLLANGIGAQEIAIATASPAGWDDHVLALAETANIPVHFVHGRAALDSPEGQLAAALAEVLLRGFSQPRVKRVVGLLRSQTTKFSEVPSQWWRKLPEDAPLLDAGRWKREIAALNPEDFPDGVDPRPRLLDIIDAAGLGLAKAAEVGERLLQGKALAIWRKALTDAPAEALDVTLAGLRVDDGLEPTVSVVWGPAAAIAAVPRPYTWLVGLDLEVLASPGQRRPSAAPSHRSLFPPRSPSGPSGRHARLRDDRGDDGQSNSSAHARGAIAADASMAFRRSIRAISWSSISRRAENPSTRRAIPIGSSPDPPNSPRSPKPAWRSRLGSIGTPTALRRTMARCAPTTRSSCRRSIGVNRRPLWRSCCAIPWDISGTTALVGLRRTKPTSRSLSTPCTSATCFTKSCRPRSSRLKRNREDLRQPRRMSKR